jgi:hypothetical protein
MSGLASFFFADNFTKTSVWERFGVIFAEREREREITSSIPKLNCAHSPREDKHLHLKKQTSLFYFRVICGVLKMFSHSLRKGVYSLFRRFFYLTNFLTIKIDLRWQ